MRKLLSSGLIVGAFLFSLTVGTLTQAQINLAPDTRDCETLAKNSYNTCLENGGSEDRCTEIYDRIIASCTPPVEPPEPEPTTCEEACEKKASEILDECIRLGVSDADCAERVARFTRSCLDRCSGDDPNDPPDNDVQRCRVRCEVTYNEAVAQCRGDNRIVNANCVERARKNYELCLIDCRPDVPPPSDPPSCESLCKLHAKSVIEACEERQAANPNGANALSDVDCQAIGEAEFERCAKRCDGGDDEPNDPPKTCEQKCDRVAHAYLDRCLMIPNVDEDACKERARVVHRRCLEGCEQAPPPTCIEICRMDAQKDFRQCVADIPDDLDDELTENEIRICREVLRNDLEECQEKCDPPPIDPECDEECRRRSNEYKQRCLDAGIDEDVCAARKHAFYRRCVRANCGPIDPPEPPTCEDRCEDHVKKLFRACLAQGDSPKDCRERLEPVLERCLNRCDHQPPPTCKERCRHGAKKLLERCLAAGFDMDRCEELATESYEICTKRCERPDPVPCDERCAVVARRIFGRCVDAFGEENEDRCKEYATSILERCVDGCEGPNEPPTCEDRCTRASRMIFDSCLDSGEDEDVCKDKATDYRDRCFQLCEEPPSCEDRCAAAVEEVHQTCLDAGGSDEACAERAREFKVRCDRRCNPEPPTCEEKCDKRVLIWKRTCIANGGDPDECKEKAVALRERCHKHCEHGPAPTCGEKCARIARRYFANCVDEHGEDQEDACKERAQHLLKECLHRCKGHPDPCPERCAHRGREVHARCMELVPGRIESCIEEGNDPDYCRQRALRNCRKQTAEFISECIEENCEPSDPPTCQDRCTRAARVLKDECIDAGGDEDACEARARAFKEECDDRCDRDPPTCEERCEEATAAVAQRCANSDLSDDECAEIVAKFKRRCLHRLEAICDRERDPDHRTPRRFRRGDVNFDDKFDISDIIGALRGMFLGEFIHLICEDAVDMNDDGDMNIGDAVAGLVNLFRGTIPIPAPNTIDRGQDASADDLLCLSVEEALGG